jgi:hypothetical protein
LWPMSNKAEYRSETKDTGPDRHVAKYLVIGREGALALGGLLDRLLRWRKLPVEEMISFDHARGLTLYEIRVQGPKAIDTDSVDLMICLNDDSLDYEPLIKASGTLVFDANSITRYPKREDIEIVAVPAFSLTQDISEGMTEEARSRFDPSISSILGSIEAVESDYPDAKTLTRIFDRIQVEQTDRFLAAVYRGYDWLQETRMRGKTANGGPLN